MRNVYVGVITSNWPLDSTIKAPLVANPCRFVYIAHKMAADGVFSTPSDAILWAIYTDLHASATRGADLESGQLTTFQLTTFQLTTFQISAPGDRMGLPLEALSGGKFTQISEYRSQDGVWCVFDTIGLHLVSVIHWSAGVYHHFIGKWSILESCRPPFLCLHHPLSLVTSLGGDNWAIMGIICYGLFNSKIWNNFILAVILWNNNYRFERSKYKLRHMEWKLLCVPAFSRNLPILLLT